MDFGKEIRYFFAQKINKHAIPGNLKENYLAAKKN